MKNQDVVDVIIVGGGAAGIGAAYELSTKSTKTWKILEARPSMCGRIQKINIDGKDIDIGAYQFAGFLSDTELISLVKSGWCKLQYRDHLNKVLYVDEEQGEFNQSELEKIEEIMKQFTGFSSKVCSDHKQSVLTMLEVVNMFKKSAKSYLQASKKIQRLFHLHLNMIEQEEAGDMDSLPAEEVLSLAEGLEQDFLDIQPIPQETYYNVMTKFVEMFPKQSVQCNTEVLEINRKSEGRVEIVAKKRDEAEGSIKKYQCKQVVCAVPLSVLKSGNIRFSPQLPEFYTSSLNKIETGVMQKIILAFQKPFWPKNTQRIKIAGFQSGIFPHFINLSGPRTQQKDEEAHILIGFMTSRPAVKMWEELSKEAIIERCMKMLQKVFPKEKIVLKEWFITEWGKTQFINQSFSRFGMEGNIEMTRQMRGGIENYLWLAGEYLFGENMGCAHGAFALGSRAGKDILRLT